MMLKYIIRQLLYAVPTLIIVSILVFGIIELPPGDYLTTYASRLAQQGADVSQEELEGLKMRYGLDQPIYIRYAKWTWGMLNGDFGMSFTAHRPVAELIWDKLGLTIYLSLLAMLIQWLIAFPIGIYSAVRQYSPGDYLATFLAFAAAAIPEFLIALVVMWYLFSRFHFTLGGLFSPEFENAEWSVARVIDMLKHLAVPLAILGITHGVGLIRTMRANMLDELPKQYVTTARSKGLTEIGLLIKYPIRLALNPFVSTVGWALPALISGTTIISIVLGLPTTGPMLLSALQNQDMYLAGSFLMILALLTIIGTLLSDILLAWLDPRIRMGE
jgi:peptide/nickel transport system permease protein